MKKRIIAIVVATVLLLTIGILSYIVYLQRHSMVYIAKNHIYEGMPRDEVEALLGEPLWITSGNTKCYYRLENGESIVIWYTAKPGSNFGVVRQYCFADTYYLDQFDYTPPGLDKIQNPVP